MWVLLSENFEYRNGCYTVRYKTRYDGMLSLLSEFTMPVDNTYGSLPQKRFSHALLSGCCVNTLIFSYGSKDTFACSACDKVALVTKSGEFEPRVGGNFSELDEQCSKTVDWLMGFHGEGVNEYESLLEASIASSEFVDFFGDLYGEALTLHRDFEQTANYKPLRGLLQRFMSENRAGVPTPFDR